MALSISDFGGSVYPGLKTGTHLASDSVISGSIKSAQLPVQYNDLSGLAVAYDVANANNVFSVIDGGADTGLNTNFLGIIVYKKSGSFKSEFSIAVGGEYRIALDTGITVKNFEPVYLTTDGKFTNVVGTNFLIPNAIFYSSYEVISPEDDGFYSIWIK